MTRQLLIAFGAVAIATSAFAQANPEVDKALLAAPPQAKEAATVIKWKADGTYDTLKAGTNNIVCYDQSGQPTEQPFSVQCTSKANLDRVKQNKKFEMEPDREKRAAAIAAAEKDGSRVKPEYGSVFWNFAGAMLIFAVLMMAAPLPGSKDAASPRPGSTCWKLRAPRSGAPTRSARPRTSKPCSASPTWNEISPRSSSISSKICGAC